MTWWTVFFPRCSPRDNCTGWLGVKHQVTCFLSKYDFVVDWVLNNNSQKPTCCCQIFTGCWHECTPRSYQTNLHELQLASPSFCFTGTWTSVGVTFLLLHRHFASITLSPKHFTSCTHTHTHRVHTIHSLHTHKHKVHAHTEFTHTHRVHTHTDTVHLQRQQRSSNTHMYTGTDTDINVFHSNNSCCFEKRMVFTEDFKQGGPSSSRLIREQVLTTVWMEGILNT